MANEDIKDDTKRLLGQFYTSNYNYIFQKLVIPKYIFENNITIVEPFAGKGDLIKYIKEQSLSYNNSYQNIEMYDIDPKQNYIIKRDTLTNPPNYNNKYIITNPPYLARNKTKIKDLYEKYDCNDLYKCFIKEILLNKCLGGIVIFPLNFFSSIRKADIELRKLFLETYRILDINMFEEKVFSDTSYTVCSVKFSNRDEEKDENNEVSINIYPDGKNIKVRLTSENNYMIGGEIYKLPLNNNIEITRLTLKNKKNTNILVKCIDDNEKIGLSIVNDDKVYIDDTPNLTARTYATLVIKPVLSEENQRLLVYKFNEFINKKRDEYHSLFLTNYRESNRKRISFDLVYDICNYILDNFILI